MKQNKIHLHSFYVKVNIMSKQNVYIRKYEHNTCKTKHCIKVMIRSLQVLRSWFPDCRMANIIRKIEEANLLSEVLSTRSQPSLPAPLPPHPREFHSNGVTFRSTTEINICRMFIELGQHYNTLYTVAYLNLSSLSADVT